MIAWLNRYEKQLWPALVLLLTLAALLLRLNRLGAESVDLEEYACLGSLDAPDFLAFLSEQRSLYPYGAPFVPTLFYLWSGIAGDHIVAMRTFVVIFGTLLIPVMYLAGCAFTGSRWAGLTAAMCTALSPAFVYQGQEARMYAFLSLGAALSCYALLRAGREDKRRWWALHFVANFVVIWSHLLGVLLVALQGLWLLWVLRGRWTPILRWGVVHFLIALPVGIWMLGIGNAGSTLYSYYQPPGLRQLRDDLLKDDVVYGSTLAWWATPPERSPWGTWHQPLHSLHFYTDPLFQGAMAAALAWGLWLLWRRRGQARAFHSQALLLLWALGPLAILVVLSHLWQPVYSSRYAGYGALAQYIMLGALVAALPWRGPRAATVVALALLYAHQLAMSLPGPMRTEWRDLLAQVEQESTPEAPLIVEDPFWLQVVHFNRENNGRVIEGGYERETLCDAAALCARAFPGADKGAWILLVTTAFEGPASIEECIESQGLHCTATPYFGERKPWLLHVTADEPVTPTPCPNREALLALQAELESPEFLDIAQRLRYEPDRHAGVYMRLGISLLRRGDVDAACALFEKGSALHPQWWDALEVILALTGEP